MIGTVCERIAALDQLYPTWEEHTLWSRFKINSEKFADSEFLVFEGLSLTYAQTRERVNTVAKSLLALNVRPGDHVALLLNNCPEFIFLIFALSEIGATKVPINAGVNREELHHVVSNSDAVFLITEYILDDAILAELPNVQKVVVTKNNPFFSSEKIIHWAEFCHLAEKVEDAELERVSRECRNPHGLSDILFTSGSTSLPKGVLVTSDMILRTAYSTCLCRHMEIGRRMFIPIPLYHAFAYVEGVLSMLLVGGTVIMSRQKFSPENALHLMRDFHANDIICVPIIMMNILTRGKPRPEDFPDLHAAYWASSCPDWVWDACRAAFGIRDITTGYGMTECGSTSTMTSPLDPSDYVKKYVGRIKPGGQAGLPELDGHQMQIKICDVETGEELPAGERGEIRCRGVTVTKGYYKDPGANAAAFDENGWFRTGDLGMFNENGCLTFLGRNNDTYKINGENVSPKFLEQIIGKCPLVNVVEVVGVCHPKCGEVGAAFVDTCDASDEGKAEIRKYCEAHLARFQIPEFFFYSNSSTWPRTASGKIKKSKLREIAEEFLGKEKV